MTASWIVVDRENGEAVMETYSPRTAAAINRERYDVVRVLDYLVGLNRKIKERYSCR